MNLFTLITGFRFFNYSGHADFTFISGVVLKPAQKNYFFIEIDNLIP